MLRLSIIAGTILCIGLGIIVLIFDRDESDLETTGGKAAPSSSESSERGARRSAELAQVGDEDEPPESEKTPTVDESSQRESAEDASSPAPEPRRIHLRVVDARTGRDLDAFRFRAVSEKRVVQATVSSPLELTLPGENLSLLIRKPGYERTRRDVVLTSGDETEDLGTIVMNRGTAAIDGRLELAAADTEVSTVQLYGDGRSPFGPPTCESDGHDLDEPKPCRRCGWRAAYSEIVPEQDSFRFSLLTSGSYLLVARDAAGAVLATKRVTLEPDENKVVVMRIEFRDITVRIEDAEHTAFDGVWNEHGLLFSARTRIFFWSDGICSAAAEIAPADAALVVNQVPDDSPPPAPKATAIKVDIGLESATKERERKQQTLARSKSSIEPVQRLRKKGEDLWPRLPSPTPHLKTRPLTARRVAPGTYEVLQVPVATSRTLASCGPIFSMSESVILKAGSATPILLVMRRQCGASTSSMWKMARESTKRISCTACHALPADVFQ